MFCPNCGNKLNGNEEFCSICGKKLNVLKPQLLHNIVSENKQIIQSKGLNGNFFRNKTKNKTIILAFIIIAVIIAFLTVILLNNKNKKQTDLNINEDVVQYNSLEKIKKDYNAGKITINEYFTQLVYLEFDTSKLDEKYSSDYIFYITECELDINNILEQHYDELDEKIIKFYLANKTLSNVSLGQEEYELQKQSDFKNNYKAQLLENKLENAYNHTLNKVHLSYNGNFLIWYSNIGDDAITEEQLIEISDGLENSITKYKEQFNIEYSYNSYVDNKFFNEDYKNAKKVLENNNIAISTLKTAMSVYIYDTGSDVTLASYNDEQDATKIINRSLFLDILDEDGIINYPYMVINKRGIDHGKESLIQLYNHELFHHMQFLYCKSTTGDRCTAGLKLTEGMANFASSKVSNVSSTNNFLNNWAGIYTINTSTKLSDIVDKGENYGYALFPYFYSYSNVVNNWSEVLMSAHNESNPFNYIQSASSKDDLIKVINDLAYKTLSQEYDIQSLKSNSGINLKSVLKDEKKYSFKINPGSIDYFELSTTSNIKINTNDSEYLTFKIYGYKNGKYNELKCSNKSIELDTAFYVNYDKFYLVVTNANLINFYNYTINIGETIYQENAEFITTFNNYNIKVEMNTQISETLVESISSGVVDELHQKEYLESDITTMGIITVSTKLYYDFNSGYTYMTQPYGGDVWWKVKGTSQLVDLGAILDKLINMKNVTKVSNNHYKVKVTKDDVRGLISSGNTDTSLIKGDIYVEVYTENGYIVKLCYDFTNLVEGFDLFTATITFSNYDNAGDVEIPQTIINNSIEV